MNNQKINIAVVGVGNLGQHHARIYSQLPDVNLVGLCDINPKRLEKICSEYNVSGYSNYKELVDKVDAVSVVVPTILHYSIAKDFLLSSKHCFVEKPLTANLLEAEELIELSQQKNVILQVGHIERFNGAILALQEYIKEPKFIECDRLGPYDPRVSDVGVILDLMIHDLDIVLYIVNSKIKDIEAYGTSVFSPYEDIVKVRLRFENGCVADLSASRVALGKYRKLRIFQPDAYFSVDYTTQRVRIYRKKSPTVKSMKDIEIISPKINRVEPLQLELEHFIQCVQQGNLPAVTGEHGRNAIELALEIIKKLQKH
ncbi:MAG: Gfo/Idh/MocA family oxidoreductase [Elusimicrobiota bacterium]|nr:Gfo/Idh/MocA family oxidoreductase [Elusimicrobiota bacterium]